MNPQSQIAHYLIISKLGAGGMGEVWRAADLKLGREVAIKILPETFAQDADRMVRFTREAQVLASLNHPNIASIHGVEERALIMELVEGPTLADRIAQGPSPLTEALAAASQIAEGLEYAHERGVVHRDLKPANIKVTPEGRVKILDFGLAKAASMDAPAIDPASSPTLTMRATQLGVIIGTAAYMSPEQAMGKPVDKRADIWSFGVVLWELLTGHRMFEGETVTDTLAGVLRAPIDFGRLPVDTPPVLRTLLRRCLDRESKTRLRDIGEARIALKEPVASGPPNVSAPPALRRFWRWIAGMSAAAALSFGALYLRRPAEEPRVVKFQILPAAKSALISASIPAVSPDGRQFAFVAASDGVHQLWIRHLDSLESRLLAGTDGAAFPFWSPDGRTIGFFANGYLKKIDIAGGPAINLCEAPSPGGGTWNQNGLIVFNAGFGSGLFSVSATGGTSAPATTLDQATGETAHRFPWFLPDGRHVLYLAINSDRAKQRIWIADLSSKKRREILPASANAVYAPPGFLLFVRDRTLMALPFNAETAQATGDAIAVAEQVDYYPSSYLSRAVFSASRNGVLVYGTGGASMGAIQLTWFDRSGKPLGTVGPPGGVNWPGISPDGKTVAVFRDDPQTGVSDVWLHDLARGSSYRLTSHPKGLSIFPLWSPDGTYVGYSSDWGGESKMYRKAASGAGTEEVLYAPKPSMRADDWSPDGRYLVGETGSSSGGGNLWLFPLFGDRKQYQFLHTEFQERQARISPDSRWLAYVTNRTGRSEVYVTSFPTAGAQTQISTGGGNFPVWSRDGKDLFYLARTRQSLWEVMAVAIKAGSRIDAGIPKPLFEVRFASSSGNTSRFDVSKDGRFLIPVEQDSSTTQSIVAVINWTAGLKQ